MKWYLLWASVACYHRLWWSYKVFIRSKWSWHLNKLILFSGKLLPMTVSSFILFAYVITTLVLDIFEKASINMSAVLESYLFSVIYLKTSSSILSLSYSDKSKYFEMFSRNYFCNRSRTVSSGVSKCTAK